MAIGLFERMKQRTGLIGAEKIMLFYWGFTMILLLCFMNSIHNPVHMFIERGLILVGVVLVWFIYKLYPCRMTFFLRILYQMALLAYWYPDTYEFCQLFPNLDHKFADAEQVLFGCQPALTFGYTFSSFFWCEALNMGYFSYYPIIAIVVLVTFFTCYHRFEKTSFIIISSFLIYYAIYLFLPVAGPQYYFQAIGLDKVMMGHFPPVGDWFRTHTELLPANVKGGFFQQLVDGTQASGERPTAAFPSSHVGMSTIMMILGYKVNKKLFVCLLPFYVLLCCSTVYVQAHYLIDVIAGFISAVFIYKISHKLYYTRLFHRPHGFSC